MIEILKESSFRSDNIIFTCVSVDGVEVGFVTHDLKKNLHNFYYMTDTEVDVTRDSPDFTTRKELIGWLNHHFA